MIFRNLMIYVKINLINLIYISKALLIEINYDTIKNIFR